MATKKLFDHLESYHPLTEDLKNFLEEKLIPLSLPKGYILLEVPKIASHVYFLNEGFAMSYTFSADRKITENFWKPGQIILAFESFAYQKPSMEVIQLVKASDLLCLSYEAFSQMMEELPEAQGLYRAMMNAHYTHIRSRIRSMKLFGHSEQYDRLLNIFPGLELIVPQRTIATYLGIAPQSLARIKAKR